MTEPSEETMMMKKQVLNKVKSIFYGIFAFIIVSMSLFQSPLERYSEIQLENKKKYKPIIKSRNFAQDSLLKELGKTLTIEEYKIARKESWTSFQNKLKFYTKIKKEANLKQSFLGRDSLKFWVFQFGLVLLGFYFAIKSLIDDFKKSISTGHEIISIIGITVCLFWFYHLFFQTAEDFYTGTYIIFKLLISLGIAYFISRLVKYYAIKDGVIKVLINLILRIKTKHYRKMTVNALYAERYDKSIDSIEGVRDQAKEFDKDIVETIKKISV